VKVQKGEQGPDKKTMAPCGRHDFGDENPANKGLDSKIYSRKQKRDPPRETRFKIHHKPAKGLNCDDRRRNLETKGILLEGAGNAIDLVS